MRAEPYKPRWVRSHQRWKVKVCSKELYYLLRKPIDIERIKPYVEYSEECMAAFIRGLGDAEGNVDRDERHLGHTMIGNTSRELLEYAQSLLERLGIHSKIYEKRMRKVAVIEGRVCTRRSESIYILMVYRKADIIKFREIIGFAIKRKQRMLEMVG